jgi:cAMP-dependent protein kinase regulator
MYFIETGEVSVTVVGNDGSERQVTTISEGGYFGELALVTHKARAATVSANAEDVRVAFLDVNAFERLLGPCMDVMKDRVDDYEDQLIRIFGSKANISDIR